MRVTGFFTWQLSERCYLATLQQVMWTMLGMVCTMSVPWRNSHLMSSTSSWKDSMLRATSVVFGMDCGVTNSLSPLLWGTDIVQEGSLASHLSRTHWRYRHLVATSAAGWNPKCKRWRRRWNPAKSSCTTKRRAKSGFKLTGKAFEAD